MVRGMHADTKLHQVLNQLNTVIVGKPQQVADCVACLLAGGHLLIEDVPGTISRPARDSKAAAITPAGPLPNTSTSQGVADCKF
jgi:hypothetical protein